MTAPPLVAVAHGSRDPAAAGATRLLMDAVRKQRPDLTVQEAYLDHGSPRLSDLAGTLSGPFVVVPLLLGAAYHSRVDIPSALTKAEGRAAQAAVLGPHRSLLAALERRLSEVGVPAGDPGTAVVLAAAGSADEPSIEAVRELAAQWRERGWWAVSAAFASAAEPSVERAVADLRAAGAPRVAVASYLLFPGLFADKVSAAGADAASAPLTDAPEVVQLVLARYDAAAS
jgi:sirohydrochlorin ferrochelatase